MGRKRPLSEEELKFCSAKLKAAIDAFFQEEADSDRLAECLEHRQAVLIQIPCTAVDFVRTTQPRMEIQVYDVPRDDVVSRVPEYLRPEIQAQFDAGYGAVLALTRDGFFRVSYYEPKN